jgi:hypothetical protein
MVIPKKYKQIDILQFPLFGKEGLGEIFLNKSPSIPLFQRGK